MKTLIALSGLKKALSEARLASRFILIGNYASELHDNKEIDLVAIIKDDADPFEFILASSSIVVAHTESLGVYIQIFPLKEKEIENKTSMFSINVSKTGVQI